MRTSRRRFNVMGLQCVRWCVSAFFDICDGLFNTPRLPGGCMCRLALDSFFWLILVLGIWFGISITPTMKIFGLWNLLTERLVNEIAPWHLGLEFLRVSDHANQVPYTGNCAKKGARLFKACESACTIFMESIFLSPQRLNLNMTIRCWLSIRSW